MTVRDDDGKIVILGLADDLAGNLVALDLLVHDDDGIDIAVGDQVEDVFLCRLTVLFPVDIGIDSEDKKGIALVFKQLIKPHDIPVRRRLINTRSAKSDEFFAVDHERPSFDDSFNQFKF